MALNILFRVLDATADGYPAPKLAELTWLELDGNLKLLADIIDVLSNSGGNVSPYDNGEEYTNALPDYVTYNGSLWRCLSASVTGVIPGTDPLIWEQSTAGSLTHVQNTDLYLAFGTANQVTAAEIREHLSNQIILTTSGTFALSVNLGLLKTNRIYKITDLDPVIFVHSYGGKVFNKHGVALMRTPLVLNMWKGDSNGGVYALGQRATFDGWVWENLTGNNTDVFPSLDATNWQIMATTTAAYTDTYFDVKLIYISGSLFPLMFWDTENGNTFNYVASITRGFPKIDGTNTNNESDYSSSFSVMNANCAIASNVMSHNSAIEIGPNSEGTGAGVSSNLLVNSFIDCISDMAGFISSNRLNNTEIVFDSGLLVTGKVDSCSFSFPKRTVIQMRSNVFLSNETISEEGSTAEEEIVAPSGSLDLEQNGLNHVYGVYWFDGGNGSVDNIAGFKNQFPVKVECRDPGGKLTVTITDKASAVAGSLVSETLAAGSYDLETDYNEYLKIVEEVNIAGSTALRVEVVKYN